MGALRLCSYITGHSQTILHLAPVPHVTAEYNPHKVFCTMATDCNLRPGHMGAKSQLPHNFTQFPGNEGNVLAKCAVLEEGVQ